MLDLYRYHAGQFSLTFFEVNFKGEDVFSFLQSQATYDISKIPDQSFQLISFLDPQGRVECYGYLTKKSNAYSYLIPKSLLEITLSRLNKFLISEDVTISEPKETTYQVILGPKAHTYVNPDAFQGNIFQEEAFLQAGIVENVLEVKATELSLWQTLSGWPSFGGEDFESTIINNLRLFDLSVIQNKGCYPGQETVSKIATRRGAAYSPVLIELDAPSELGDVFSFERKIGSATQLSEWKGKYYLTASLLRDFRVEKMKLHFLINNKEHKGIVRYYTLIPGDKAHKALELYYDASEDFKHDALIEAEKKYRLAIELDPTLADAYESLGVMLGRLERYQEAIELMENLSRVNPKSVLAHTNMSLFLMKLGKIPEAEEQKSLATVKSFQSFGDEAKDKEAQKARAQAQENEWASRISMFEQVLEIDPEDTLANYGLGSIAVEKGDWLKAQGHLESVLKADPKYSVAYLALGRALKGLGKNSEAKAIWLEGVKVAAAKGDLMPANQMQQELNF